MRGTTVSLMPTVQVLFPTIFGFIGLHRGQPLGCSRPRPLCVCSKMGDVFTTLTRFSCHQRDGARKGDGLGVASELRKERTAETPSALRKAVAGLKPWRC